MKFDWLKRYMPQGLYGRAALILVLPVVTVQLVVSVVFIQRHFEDVTSQMTRNVLAEVRYLIARVNDQPDLASAIARAESLAPELQLAVQMPATLLSEDCRPLIDLTGRTVIAVLQGRLNQLTGVDLCTNAREVRITVDTKHGGLELRLPRSRVSASNPHQLLVLMLVTGLLMTLISFVFLRNQLRPITRLSQAAEAFGKGRNVKYKPAGATEVRAAGAAFLDMRARIERQIEQRTLMLSGISHDLRTPLTRLKLALSMQDNSDETAEMERDVSEMQRLVEEFLSFARGDALDDAVEVDPAALAKAAVDAAQRSGQNAELAQVDETGPSLMRPLAVTRALDNLIGNALHYGECVRVSVIATRRSIIFRVEDDGPGIPEDQRAEAVKPFARLDPARNQNHRSGVGLGLAIASDIARKHGGVLKLYRSETMGGLCADLVVAR